MNKRAFSLIRMLIVLLISILIVNPVKSQANSDQYSSQGVSGVGFDDLAVGVPGESLGSITHPLEGAVNVLYGADSGLTATGNQLWNQDVPGMPGHPRLEDEFGNALTAGDFDNDGYSDLAIAVPNDYGLYDGVVHIIYGSSYGLGVNDNQLWEGEFPNAYGYALASGDMNGDGYDDLVVSSPHYSQSYGGVDILYGSADGLSTDGSQFWYQGSPGILGSPEADDRFGEALAVGDLNGDGFDDLAVGVVGESVNPYAEAGAVNVIYGSAGGLTDVGNQLWHKDQPGIGGDPAAGDHFGSALAIGDMNADGFADLAIGVPGEDYIYVDTGAVYVLPGSANGLIADGHQIWNQDVPDVEGSCEAGDKFGRPLASGDLNSDGYDDLAVGVVNESIGDRNTADGAVNVLYGSAEGLSATGDQIWHRGLEDMQGGLGADQFGSALAMGDINGDGFTDLAIGAPYDDFGIELSTGSINIIFGSTVGLTVDGNQFWHQDKPGIKESADLGDIFGTSLAIGNFNGGDILFERLFLPIVISAH